MAKQTVYDTIVIGAGPAGLTAGIYLPRAGYTVLILEENFYGGQMANTPEVDNYPATGRMSGRALSESLYQQALEMGAEVELDGAVTLELAGTHKRVTTRMGSILEARTIILANGARRRKLDIPGEDTFAGRGVSYCAACDGGFFKGKTAAVVGGGNTALEDALYLANLCAKVYLIHRRDAFRGTKALADAVRAHPGIELCLSAAPQEILPEATGSRVGGLRILQADSGTARLLDTDAVFVAVGLEPDNALAAGQLELDAAGYIRAGEDTRTNLPGVYAAGDTRTKSLRQIVTAASDGAVAAAEAGAYMALLPGKK